MGDILLLNSLKVSIGLFEHSGIEPRLRQRGAGIVGLYSLDAVYSRSSTLRS